MVAIATKGRSVTVIVSGVPVGQGNMKAFVVAGRPQVTHSNGSRLSAWRLSIADAVARQYGEEIELMSGPLRLSAAFRLPRPASLPKTKKRWPIGRRSGDLDHYLRALGDAVTGVLIDDDSQIVHVQELTKDFANVGAAPGVVFTLEEIQ